MSLYGALYSSVSGLRAQSNKIGVISDNISNANTVAYKQGQSLFETLVTNSGIATAYSPGGVQAQNRTLVSKQGLIQGTDNATDVAISGRGFFVVKNGPDSSASVLYTRAGSFRQDNQGNFRNAAGFYLQGWPLDSEGRLPGEAGNVNTNSTNNLSSLQPVNVLSATGAAAGTSAVNVSVNVTASQTVYPGASDTVDVDGNTVNANLPAKSLIVPGVLNGTSTSSDVNHIERGDQFSVITGAGLNYTYRYGGFTYSRSVNGELGDSGQSQVASPLVLLASPFQTFNGDTTVRVTAANHGLISGDVVTLSGQSATLNNIPAADFNQKFVVTFVDEDHFEIEVETAANANGTGGTTGINVATRPFAGNVLDASTSTGRFLGTTGVSGFTDTGLTFTVTTDTVGTVTFTYVNSAPNAQLHQFNTMENLANAINSVTGLVARVSGGRLYISSADPAEAVTFANGSVVGTSSPSVKAGIDWLRELGLSNIAAGDNRFNSLQSLANLVNASSGITAVLSGALTDATLKINVDDPLDTIEFADLETADPLTAFTSTTPFTTTSGSRTVTVTHPAPHGLSTGDIVDVDSSGLSGFPTAYDATGAFATTSTDTTVVITKTAHGFSDGDVVYIDPSDLAGYPTGTINGIPISDFKGLFTVANSTANTFEIEVDTAATSTTTGGSGDLLISPTFNGVPMSDLHGKFEITVTGPSTYTIQVVNAATATGTTGAAGLVITPPNNTGSLLAEFGLVDSLEGGTYTPQAVTPIGPQYDATDTTKSMSGGNITPHFSQNVRVYDSFGTGHDLKISFIKIATNTWAAEVYASVEDEVTSSFTDGLLAYGTLTFNGDGSLRIVSPGLSNAIAANWTNGSNQSEITFDWGTAGEPFGTVGAAQTGKTDGMTQFDADYRVNFINQNGAAVGQLVSVTITEEGFVVANYNNGESQNLFKLPIADFSNPDELTATSGNVYAQSNRSGEPNLREAGTNGAGGIQASAQESSTVELADQMTDLIVAQRAYQANTKVVTTTDSLLEELNNILR